MTEEILNLFKQNLNKEKTKQRNIKKAAKLEKENEVIKEYLKLRDIEPTTVKIETHIEIIQRILNPNQPNGSLLHLIKKPETNHIYVLMRSYNFNDDNFEYTTKEIFGTPKEDARCFRNIEIANDLTPVMIRDIERFEKENIVLYPKEILEDDSHSMPIETYKRIQAEFFAKAAAVGQEKAKQYIIKKYNTKK